MYSSPPHHQKENLVEKKKSSKFVTHVVRVEIGIEVILLPNYYKS